jgi:hypothetical protein
VTHRSMTVSIYNVRGKSTEHRKYEYLELGCCSFHILYAEKQERKYPF